MVVYYPGGKLWKERFYHGVVAEVGDTVLREWDDDEFVQVRLRVDFGDGSHEVRCCSQHCTISSQRGHCMIICICCVLYKVIFVVFNWRQYQYLEAY